MISICMALRKSLLLFVAVAAVSGCAPQQIPKEALQFSQESPELRRLQTRRFQTTDEQRLLTAGAGILQEMGFAIDTRETRLGVIAGSKKQSLDSLGEKAASFAVAVLTGQLGFPYGMPVSKDELVKVSLVTRPSENPKDTFVRLTLQRVVWNSEDKVRSSELLKEPEVYRQFFEGLGKAVSLEVHEL